MKTAKRNMLALFLILGINNVFGQLGTVAAVVTKPGFTIGLNGIYGLPMNDFKSGYKYGVGGEVYGGIGWGKTFIIATIGYNSYTGQNSATPKLTIIPVKAGIKQMFMINRLFIQADAGMASVKSIGDAEVQFAFGGGVGVRLVGIEVGAYYDNFKSGGATANSLLFKAGYNFTL